MLSSGIGEFGRLGTGSVSDAHIPMSLDVLEDETIIQVVAGTSHSLALSAR